MSYFLPDGYVVRKELPEWNDHTAIRDTGIVWQPEVYELASRLATTSIADIGCGHAEKLESLSSRMDVLGFDTPANISWCEVNHAWGQWVPIDLDSDVAPLSLIPTNAVIVFSDVIEHLMNPHLVLKALSGMTFSYCIVSTPDRERLAPCHRGPPVNPAHVREWSSDEFVRLLRHYELPVLWHGHTRRNNRVRVPTTTMVLLGHRPVHKLKLRTIRTSAASRFRSIMARFRKLKRKVAGHWNR